MAPTDAPPAAGRFDCLSDLRTAHAELLADIPGETLTPEQEARVKAFIARGVATGTILDAPEDRSAAQGLLNYWTASLYTAGGPRHRGGTDRPRGTVALLADYDEESARGLDKAAEEAVGRMSEADRGVARQILLRLVRLAPEGTAFVPTPQPRAAFDGVGEPGQATRVLGALEFARVIRVTVGPTTGEDRIELASAPLTRSWPRLAEWLKQRTDLRAAARLWHERRCAPISGVPLALALDYRDLNPVEAEFVAASRGAARRAQVVRQWAITAAGAALIVGLAVIVFLQRAWREEADARRVAAEQVAVEEHKTAVAVREKAALQDQLDEADRQKRVKAERVLNVARLTRALGDYAVAERGWEKIARMRLDDLVPLLRQDEMLAAFLDKYATELDQLREASNARNRGLKVLELTRALRTELDARPDETITAALLSTREMAYRTVEQVTCELVCSAGGGKTAEELRPFVSEFWRFYWSSMGLVEGIEVEKAMVWFGGVLRQWENDKGPASPERRKELTTARDALLGAFESELKHPGLAPRYED